jgi:hypothetical protein
LPRVRGFALRDRSTRFLNRGGHMLGRTSLAAGLLVLLAPVLGAQATTKPTPRLRAPRLAADNALLALLPSARLARGLTCGHR